MNVSRWWLAVAAAGVVGCAGPSSQRAEALDGYGVLVMAHGGSKTWNEAVVQAVDPLERSYPLEIAFGMAEPASLEASIAKLEARGVTRIGVVRLFVSGDSFRERTEEILGLRDGAPPKPAAAAHDHGGAHDEHSMELWRVRSGAAFALSDDGLNAAPEMDQVLLDRVRELARNPAREDVLILAHGPGDDDENRRWLALMDRRTAATRAALPFHEVRVATLREDWPDKRAAAESEIRGFVQASAAAGRRVLVVPFRIEGFGPYREVLGGLDYSASEVGLLPHENVTLWIGREAEQLRTREFRAPLP